MLFFFPQWEIEIKLSNFLSEIIDESDNDDGLVTLIGAMYIIIFYVCNTKDAKRRLWRDPLKAITYIIVNDIKMNASEQIEAIKNKFLFVLMFTSNAVHSCFTTSTISSPTVTTASPGIIACCPALTQTLSPSTAFADGVLTFTYDDNNCRTAFVANCSQPNAALQLNAAITVNTANFLVVGPLNVTFPGTCDANGNWEVGTPALVVQDIECLLTNPTG